MKIMAKRISNPGNDIFRYLVSLMPNAVMTEWGNFSVRTRVTARSSQYTFFVSNDECAYQSIHLDDYKKISKLQDNYTRTQDMIEVIGTIGIEPPVCVPASLLVESRAANIAAMQSQLYFHYSDCIEPLFKVIYTPNLSPEIFSLPILIAVNLEDYTTRILGTDYFGESKKAGLRMWNKWIYDLGGLALHAGCKTYRNQCGEEKAVIIIGLSGTGKTTTTFKQHLGSLPVQDDFCALFPDGRLFASENGCFAKTFGLDEGHEPIIYHALKQSEAWLENVSVDENGKVDYSNGSYTTNGRGTFTLDKIEHRNPIQLPDVSHIIILNRNFDIIPAMALLKREQATEYFMLGETTGTSAGGEAEAGKFLRVPGTNPFFFTDNALQGERFNDILKQNPEIKVILMNTGCIGGRPKEPGSIKIEISHSSALLEALLRDEIEWRENGDFGYFLPANSIPKCPPEVIDPHIYYLRSGRIEEYHKIVAFLKISRKKYFEKNALNL